ncbi:hypothetical protein Tco_0672255 [Tanacetum coccineum]
MEQRMFAQLGYRKKKWGMRMNEGLWVLFIGLETSFEVLATSFDATARKEETRDHVASRGWSFASAVPGQMTHLVAISTLKCKLPACASKQLQPRQQLVYRMHPVSWLVVEPNGDEDPTGISDGGNTGDGVKIAGGVIGSGDEIGLRFLNFFNDPRIIREQIIAAYKGYRGGGHMGDDVESLGAVLERLWCKVEVDGGGFGSCGVRG